jgi:hypothetical protein
MQTQELIFWAVIAHFVADWALQNPQRAEQKGTLSVRSAYKTAWQLWKRLKQETHDANDRRQQSP